MSQSRNSPDTQALLQSMLQRLKLQPGREGQAHPHSPVPNTAAPTWGQDGQRGASEPQKVNNSPVNGFGSNGVGISAAGSNFVLKGGDGCEVDRGLISSPTQKHNIDGDTGENRVLGQPTVTPTGTRQLFPARSLKDADITSFERTDAERGSFGSPATSIGQSQDQNQGFTPKVYTWSLKPEVANLFTGSQEDQALHVGNGGFEAQSKEAQISPTGQTNSGSRRKQRSSENKTRRWTQKIKERWRDRPGSFRKKEKEGEGRDDHKSEQATEISPQNQRLTTDTLLNTSNQEEERTLPSPNSSDPIKPHSEDGTNEGHMRPISDFEFSLGSFSLLEEIVTGQEWAKFLKPNHSAASANQRPSEEPPSLFKITTNPPLSLNLNQHGGVNNQWSFRGSEASSPESDFSMAQISPDTFQPVSMDVTEGKQQPYVHRMAYQSEPMEHGHTRRPPSFVQPSDILMNSALKSRVQLSRKRQHQSAEMRDERLQTEKMNDGKEADRGSTSSHVMEESGESQHDDNMMPLYTLNSPPQPLSPSSFNPFAPIPRGVLKHSISQNSEPSMEVMTKRRRVEENRRVHFSEQVVSIAPPEPDLDATDSEEDSEAEEDSVTEQECEAEPAAAAVMVEEVAPSRRAALPAWILALKRRNTGRKPR